MIMKMEFGIKIYTQVFHWLSLSYSRIKKFIPVYQIVGFPGEHYNLGFVNIKFHIVLCTPTAYWIDVRLKAITVFRRADNIICKEKIPGVLDRITQVIHIYIEKQRPKNRSLRNTGQNFKRRWSGLTNSGLWLCRLGNCASSLRDLQKIQGH
jgi:hypothetical protein